MKIISARFENFRLLRDLELTFATNPAKHLTVIRAANESGKTTILLALQWALYGDAALPAGGVNFRLHPIDWDASVGTRVPISVSVEFEISRMNRNRETTYRYRIVRTASEELVGTGFERRESTAKLYSRHEEGDRLIDYPDTTIREALPLELREVFFTDGDRALSFLDADVAISTKRERVQRAIRSLLALGIIEDATKHVEKVKAEINRRINREAGDQELGRVTKRIDALTSERDKYTQDFEDASTQMSNLDAELLELDRKLTAALEKGNQEALAKERDSAKKTVAGLDQRLEDAKMRHSELFKSPLLAKNLLASVLNPAFKKLDDLRDQRKIPNTTIPVLEERLSQKICICGETLDADTSDGSRRRQHIEHLIEGSRRSDEIQETLTSLYFAATTLRTSPDQSTDEWLEAYKAIVRDRDELAALRSVEGQKLAGLETRIADLGNTDVQGLREHRATFNQTRDRMAHKRAAAETRLSGINDELRGLSAERERLLKSQTKTTEFLAELDVASDVRDILDRSYKRLTQEELTKVSTTMNGIFLDMIGADPEQGAIIKRATVSLEFDILVYGPHDRKLNPDKDLNGASRRALTLAFILALTKVSDFDAPNVIDTPLGMMSGYVKRSVLKILIRESKQLVLFLTHSEIEGCEEILDSSAGNFVTLTNPAHYPIMLANDPGTSERKVLLCNCDHRHECSVCTRKVEAVA